ncbi:Two component transcriptional regulator, winged helix family [Thermoclostridium stercorarium subsp. stercorarium DSM 8532]|uniref:Stage 0 sporulation protein A homolog n=3 Tax=Thermoclostridium stercorarium TaxID=1510 RepID=L7VNS3_THES1|nr:response regulator transcription factor [Thermoclostridium stercorarium]AGC68432.1 Two component transcriptional regulator, winged helix family [Thermoclostridium stercorarium subsp. stercorarium DSM 8532]ANX00020.1 DNA-binding response regulator [Thermoclostridium stercorarium subsp. thermolacticum DSM 2910]ANX02663.1 DNA-binding response regulator [Thermoclostridium stercorarium subsp. leptospartum DSM 9219]UZQ84431.1 response regulator transcription factor [Thermoclostridium stercorarium]
MAEKILIIEDDTRLARFLELELRHEGYEVEIAYDGRSGLEKALSNNPDLVILDLMLPLLSGIEVLRRIRKVSDMPVIMLTAKDDVSDKVVGLDSGADDYVTKPFAIEELLARIRVALKRRDNSAKRESDIIRAGDLVLNKAKHTVMYKDEEITLSKKEYDLLEYLMENRGIVLTREQILEKVWGYDYFGDTNVTDVYIRYLRAKIDQKYNLSYIKTVRGVGYIFEDGE